MKRENGGDFMTEVIPPLSRRAEYAEATRRAIVAAARELFSKQGFFSTKVDEIAARARVSPATVYAVSGGKHGLLLAAIDSTGCHAATNVTVSRIRTMNDPVAILRLLASTCRMMREDFGDVMRVMLNTAPHDKTVAEIQDAVTARYRGALASVSQRLAKLGALRQGLDADQAADVLWFYFGYSGLFTLHDENGWSYARAEEWLCREASRALLRPQASEPEQAALPPSPSGFTAPAIATTKTERKSSPANG
jgi:AcrR family transcriptional regulator